MPEADKDAGYECACEPRDSGGCEARRRGTPDLCSAKDIADYDAVHWGSVNARPTSLHGNGAASFDRTTLNWHAVTCRLCLSLRGSEDVPCPEKTCSATHRGACRYPGWQMCMHPGVCVTPPGAPDA